MLDGYDAASDDDAKQKVELEAAARDMMTTQIDMDAVKDSLDKNFEHPFWEQAGEA